jgi:hypothetical protein
LRRWVTGLEVTGELVEVAAVEFEEVVTVGSPEEGPDKIKEVGIGGRSPAWGGTRRRLVISLRTCPQG